MRGIAIVEGRYIVCEVPFGQWVKLTRKLGQQGAYRECLRAWKERNNG